MHFITNLSLEWRHAHIKTNHYNNTNHIVYITGYYQGKHAYYDKTENKTIQQTLTKYPGINKMF